MESLSDLSRSERPRREGRIREGRIEQEGHGRVGDVPDREGWLTIREASALLGVSSATVRRWCEAGDLEAFVTPGGHRRFTRDAVLALLPHAEPPRRSLRDLGETPDRIVRAYRRELIEARGSMAWLGDLDDASRAAFRGPGRTILTSLLEFLDATSTAEAEGAMGRAETAVIAYGRIAAEQRVSLHRAVDAFLRFRLPFLRELGSVARRRRLGAPQALDLLLAAEQAFDRLLRALIEGHTLAAATVDRPSAGTGATAGDAIDRAVPGPTTADPSSATIA